MSTIKIKIVICEQINISFKHILTVSSKEGPFQSKSHHQRKPLSWSKTKFGHSKVDFMFIT